MSVHFLANQLSKWDGVEAGALVLTFFSDERPLRGAAGLADWRLCGRLSQLLKRERLRGELGETLMMPPGRRLGFRRLLLFGLGHSRDFSETAFRDFAGQICGVLERAKVVDYAVQPPGRATGLIAARRALELWLETANERSAGNKDLYVIDSPGAQKEMADILHAHQRYSEAQKERERQERQERRRSRPA